MSGFMIRLAFLPVVVLGVACGAPDDATDFDAEGNENAVSQLVASDDDSSTATASQQVIASGSSSVDVYAGYCSGSAMPRIGSAYFMSPQLAITGGSLIGSRNAVCLARGTADGAITYFDVHAIRKTGSSYGGLAGLSLMRASGEGRGFDVVPGTLGVGLEVVVEGTYAGTSNSSGTYSAVGPTVASDAFTGTMHAAAYPRPAPTHPHFLGGGAVYLSGSEHPMGVQWGVADTPTGVDTLSERYIFRRNQLADIDIVNQWNATAAPAQTISITSIAHLSTRTGGWSPADVLVQQNPVLPYTIVLDGIKYVPGTNTGLHPTVGWHTLAVYLNDYPNIRHTIRFLQQ